MTALMDYRRRSLLAALGAGGGLLLSGCDRLNASPAFRDLLRSAERGNDVLQRGLIGPALAQEFSEQDISPFFRGNGTQLPDTQVYRQHLASGFRDWRLVIDGLVERPLAMPLLALLRFPQRTQITRHDCVEGWSAIGKWTGPRLADLLKAAGLRSHARYIVFHCADSIGGAPYYESIGLEDAFHPQTIIAHHLNDRPLPVHNGAPLRLRVERQLGYKHAKYVMRIEARASLGDLYGGRGGLWEDRSGYQWYAGI